MSRDNSVLDVETAMFVSEEKMPGPQFRLMYELKGGVMSGKFHVKMPGGAEWKSYLEWSGGRAGSEGRGGGQSL